jgi:predicted MFS family arabinose efflux permease
LALLGGAARASTFVLVALFLQQALRMDPQHAGLAMVPTSLAGLVANLALLPRALRRLGEQRTLVLGMLVLAGGHLWLAYAPAGAGYAVAVLPGLLLVAVGVALSFTPTTMVLVAATPQTHAGLASGLAGSATQVGSALGTSLFTAIGIAVGGAAAGTLSPTGFTAAFTAAAVTSLAAAALGCTLTSHRTGSATGSR